MKITICPLQQKKAGFVVDAEPSETIRELKLKIAADRGHPVESQKIFNSGICLQDDKTIGSYSIKDASQLILILKGAPAGSVSSSSPSGPRTTTALPASASPPPASTPAPALAPAPTPTRPTPPGPGGATFSGSGISSNVGASRTNIDSIMNMGMGFTEEHVIHALRASFDNPDQAVELLLNSEAVSSAPQAPNFREKLSNVPRATTASGPDSDSPQDLLQSMLQRQLGGLNGMGDTGGPGNGDDAAPIEIDPAQVYEIRRMVAENPALTGPLIESIRATDPEGAAHLSTSDPDGIIRFFSPIAPTR